MKEPPIEIFVIRRTSCQVMIKARKGPVHVYATTEALARTFVQNRWEAYVTKKVAERLEK